MRFVYGGGCYGKANTLELIDAEGTRKAFTGQ
jgi:hypothetical protein